MSNGIQQRAQIWILLKNKFVARAKKRGGKRGAAGVFRRPATVKNHYISAILFYHDSRGRYRGGHFLGKQRVKNNFFYEFMRLGDVLALHNGVKLV